MATKTSLGSSSASTGKKQATRGGATKFKSRAVIRDVEAGSTVDCVHCDERVKFQAKVRNKQAICNIYINGAWNRVEHYHADCYVAAGEPYGEAEVGTDYRRQAANAAAADRAKKLASEAQAAAQTA